MTKWVIVCKPTTYNIEQALNDNNNIFWRMDKNNYKIGDTVYLYITGYLSSIKYKLMVKRINVNTNLFNEDEYYYKANNYEDLYMDLELLKVYHDDLLNKEFLKQNGLKKLRGLTEITEKLDNAIEFRYSQGLPQRQREVFFVFQSKYFNKEYKEGYLRAPKHKKDGSDTANWSLMKKVRKGDIIIHSVTQKVKAISIAKSDVNDHIKPDELGKSWKSNGWRIDTEYITIPNSINTKEHKDKIYTLQPKGIGPFSKVKKGKQGYLYRGNNSLLNYILSESLKLDGNDELRSRIDELTQEGLIAEDLADEEEIIDINNDYNLEEGGQIETSESPQDKKELISNKSGEKYPRNKEVAKNSLKLSNFKCEINNEHFTFNRKNNGLPYTEPHHLIPLSRHDDFENSLDVEYNIVSLCSNCHNEIHYGENYEKLITQLYNQRQEMLELMKIDVSLETLISYYN